MKGIGEGGAVSHLHRCVEKHIVQGKSKSTKTTLAKNSQQMEGMTWLKLETRKGGIPGNKLANLYKKTSWDGKALRLNGCHTLEKGDSVL